MFPLLILTAICGLADPVAEALAKPILAPRQTLAELQEFVESRIPPMPTVVSAAEWSDRARGYRSSILKLVVFRGEAAKWRDLPTRPQWLGEIAGGRGYRIKKLRFEVVPGMWIPALLYEPTELRGKAPVVLNVNGHDGQGKVADYKQIRCINQAKRGMIALNLEWFGMGQLAGPGFSHGLINAIDLCGTSGVALHYLAMTRGIDILLAQENADPSRVGVTGLSGGGWQTIFVSSLDDRVTLTDPVAGYSSFRTRVRFESDLGDSEQTPCDLATIADYTHLTAMMAPRPTLLTFNGKDNCCFAAPHALPPLQDAAGPIFDLFGVRGTFRSHVNMDPGDHNYGLDNRQALYQMMADHWSQPGYAISPTEIVSDSELKSAQDLKVELPSDNLDFQELADRIATDLPRAKRDRAGPSSRGQSDVLLRLRSIVRPIGGEVTAQKGEVSDSAGITATAWRVRLGTQWTIPVVELARSGSEGTVVLIGDEGRAKLADRAKALLEEGRRVIVLDLYGFGENAPPSHVYLYALLIGTIGERPLGLACGELIAVTSWRKQVDSSAPVVESMGPRNGAIAQIAAALDHDTISVARLRNPMESFREIISSGRDYSASPELFCFGLLSMCDLDDLRHMATPGRIVISAP